jgi:hypothetical protein
MRPSFIASLLAVASWGFIEIFARNYPARQLWWRMRRSRGRDAIRKMRERFEWGAARRTPKVLAGVVLALIAAWVSAASLLDKRWTEVVGDSLPSAIVLVALLRTPGALRKVAERMKTYEREAGDEPDAPSTDGGPTAIAL